MSHGLQRVEPRRGLMVFHPRQWTLWRERKVVIAYILTVDFLALVLAATILVAMPIRSGDLVRFGLLVAGAVVHREAVHRIEGLRERTTGNGLLTNLSSLWIFAAALSVPLPLVVGLTGIVHLHSWYRGGAVRLYRKVFSVYPIVPRGPVGLVVLVGAGAVFWLVNYALVVGAVIMSGPLEPGRQALGNPSDQIVVAASLGLGVGFAVMLAFTPWLIAVLITTVFALHRALLLPHFQQAARTDSKTGLLTAGFWREAAGRELARARRLADPLGVLMLDLDHFKSFNDRMGHLVGDQVLRAVADELRSQTRPYDLVGRFGGEEFVILLSGVGTAQVEDIADRIRERISQLRVLVDSPHDRPVTVDGISISIGAAVRPNDGDDIDHLLLAADGALLAAKAAGRDRVRLATR
jgi:diguanylate cyclase (GGDEF)-like protein